MTRTYLKIAALANTAFPQEGAGEASEKCSFTPCKLRFFDRFRLVLPTLANFEIGSTRFIAKWMMIAVAGALVSCGAPMGGGESGTGMTPKTTMGKITNFGSVFVNGVEYFTTGATFSAEGLATDESALRVGMVVTLTGAVASNGTQGVASAIHYSDEVEGVVTAVYDSLTGSFSVMGQTIQTDKNTVFSGNGSGVNALSDLVLNNVVEVSGFTSGNGTVYATRVEVKSPNYVGQELEIKGVVHTLDAVAHTFLIGGTVVDYAAIVSALSFSLAADQYVKVKTVSYNAAGNSLVASAIELQNGGKISPILTPGETLEMEGVVTSYLQSGLMAVNGQVISIADPNQFDAALISALSLSSALGMEIEVEGSIDAQGRLVASELMQELGDDTTYVATIGSVDAAANTANVLGITVKVDNNTIMEDDSAAKVQHFTLSYLNANTDPVEVSGSFSFDPVTQRKQLIATKFKRLGAVPAQYQVEGPTTDACPSSGVKTATVAGVVIDYTTLSVVVPATCGKVSSTFSLSGGTYVASTIEFKN